MRTLLGFLLLFLSACQLKPTKTNENLSMGPNPEASRNITEQTVVLDTRPLFAYTSGHIPQAQSVRWDFYGSRENPGIMREAATVARELARLGISPEKHVVVVGLGKGGMGEEGRVAWMLNYLGVKNVSFASDAFFKMKRKTGDVTPNQNVENWSPELDETLKATKAELAQYRVIDVRSVDEYLGKNPDTPVRPDIGAINVPWTEFIDDNGFPNRKIAAQLAAIGVSKDKRVVLISEEGTRSALATLVLRELGYKNAANFAGGFKELFARKK